jgi:cation-transporting ATPase 13A2
MIYTLSLQLSKYAVPLKETLLRAADLITIVVPPALPIVLTIGSYSSLRRLKERGVYCSAPQRFVFLSSTLCNPACRRIIQAGKVSIVCFDKTGTLTAKSMTVASARAIQSPQYVDSPLSFSVYRG